MRPLRVLFGALPAALLTSLTEAISARTEIEIAGVARRPTVLLAEAGTLEADVVVVAWDGLVTPGIVSHLLDQYPHLRVVAVTADGRRVLRSALRPHAEQVAVHSPDDLVAVLRSPDDGPPDS